MPHSIVRSAWFYAIIERIVPFIALSIITIPLWLSPFHPALVAYFVLGYILFFSMKSLKTIYHAWISYAIFEKSLKIPWSKEVKSLPHHEDIVHYFVITTVREPVEKLETTLEYMKKQTFPLEQVHIVLAMEEREGESAKERAAILQKKYKGVFSSIEAYYHVLQEGEIIGKASNETSAVKRIYSELEKKGKDPKNVLITICDADSLMPPEYLSCLTYKYLSDPDRQYHFYAAPVLLYNHFWRLPVFIRMQMILSGVVRLSLLSQEREFIQLSTYSASLWLIHTVGYWDTDIIPEDWHIQIQAFFTYGGKVRTIPIYLPVVRDAVLSTSLRKTFHLRYEQEKRWAWGVTDIPYAIVRSFETPHIPIWTKLQKLWYITENHLLWPTSFFVLTVSGWIPGLINPAFKRTVLGFLLPQLSSLLLTAMTLTLGLILYYDHKLRGHIDIKTEPKKVPMLFIQWYFMPIVSFAFSSLPALESHVRLLLGKKIEYKATEKIT